MAFEFEYLRNSFEGQVPGATASAANSASSGSGFSNVVNAGGGVVTYVDRGAGDTGLRVTPGTAESYGRFTAVTARRRAVARRSVTVPAVPSVTAVVLRILAGSTQMAGLAVTTGGAWIASQGSNISASLGGSVQAGATYWVELAATAATSAQAADGVVEYRVYAADGTTLLREWSSGPTRSLTVFPNILRYSGVGSSSGWSHDDTSAVEGLFADRSAIWIERRPWIDAQAPVAVDPPSDAVVHAGLSPVSIAATGYTWRIVEGNPLPYAPRGADLVLHVKGAEAPQSLILGVTAHSPSGISEGQTIAVVVAGATTFVCLDGLWAPASRGTRALVDALLG